MIHPQTRGPHLSADDVDAFGGHAQVQLPASYRNFLLEWNGGIPLQNVIDVANLIGSPTDVQEFFGIGLDIPTSNLGWNLQLIEALRPIFRAVPVARDSGGNLFCLDVELGVAGRVVYCDLGLPEATYPVANSFGEFLEQLRDFE